ncbi:MAG: flavodoxin family protein [Candidatus Izemoplasmatales bacterium]
MQIAIIIHSETGHTLAVATKMQTKLIAAGHQVSLARIQARNDREVDEQKIEFINCPKLPIADAYIFGAPVRGFMLSPLMKAYLNQIDDLSKKPVICFLTQHFPFKWMGGNQAMKQFKALLLNKNAHIKNHHIFNWSAKKKREKQINVAIHQLDFS